LSRQTLGDDLSQKALAHVLWGSMAYQEQLFRLPGQDRETVMLRD